MAHGKRSEERMLVVAQSAWVWCPSENATPYSVDRYVRLGALPNGEERRMPYMPEVEVKIAEIHRNNGRLIVTP